VNRLPKLTAILGQMRLTDQAMELVQAGILTPQDARRIISRAEEPMEETRTDISAKEMNEFWEEERQKARDGMRFGNQRIQPQWSAVAIREHHDIQRQRLAAGMGIPIVADPSLKPGEFRIAMKQPDGRFPCALGCNNRVANPICNAHKKPATPPPRAHDFSNPYLLDGGWMGPRQCVACGDRRATIDSARSINGATCTPDPTWRARHEAEIANDTDHQSRNRRLNRTPPKAQPYQNDVSGIGALMGQYHNCAPERGR
jgi:hypothetical protein